MWIRSTHGVRRDAVRTFLREVFFVDFDLADFAAAGARAFHCLSEARLLAGRFVRMNDAFGSGAIVGAFGRLRGGGLRRLDGAFEQCLRRLFAPLLRCSRFSDCLAHFSAALMFGKKTP